MESSAVIKSVRLSIKRWVLVCVGVGRSRSQISHTKPIPNMTSPPSPNPSASGQRSSELGEAAENEAAAQAHSPLQSRQPISLNISPPITLTSSLPPSSSAYGFPYPSGSPIAAVPATSPVPRDCEAWQEPLKERPTSLKSAKRPLSLSELRPPKLRRDSQDAQRPASPAEHILSLRGQSSSRAQAPPSTRYNTFIEARAPPLLSAKRPPGRPRKNPPPSNATQFPRSLRRDEDEDYAIPPATPIGIGVSAIQSPSPTFHDPSGTPSSTSPRSNAQDSMALVGYQPGATLASHYEARCAGPHLQLPELPKFLYPHHAGVSPRLGGPQIANYSMSPPVRPSTPTDFYKNEYKSSNASSPSYPYRTLPTSSPVGSTQSQRHESLPLQLPTQDTAFAALDGFKILRNAVPVALVRSLASVVQKGLPVTVHSDTHQAYSMPFHGYLLRDDFNSVSPF